MTQNFLKLKNGFTVLEVVVALGIVTVGLLGVMTLVIQNLQVHDTNKDSFIASMLAQEGLELVRNDRDNNWFDGYAGDGWKYGIGSDPASDIVQDGKYKIYRDGTIDGDADDFDDAQLFLDSNGFYDHNTTASATPFYRLITISDDDPDYITASSTVKWNNRGKAYSYTAATKLYDWK